MRRVDRKGDTARPMFPKRPLNAERPFPWRCRKCGRDAVVMTTIEYDAEVRHDGRMHAFTVPSLRIPVCAECGEKVFTEDVDAQINDALRRFEARDVAAGAP